MRDPINAAFRVTLIAAALFIALVIFDAAVPAIVHPGAAAVIAAICAFVSFDAWRGR